MRADTRRASPVQIVVLVAAAAGAIGAGVLEIGTPSSSSGTEIRLAAVQRGVVQTTVSASGNLEPATEVGLNFKASGILTELYVQAGQHVKAGQLLAEIDPTTAQVALEQAQATLKSAQANLASVEADPSGSSSTSAGSGSRGTASAASVATTAALERSPLARTAAYPGPGSTGSTGYSGATGAASGSGSAGGSASPAGTTGTAGTGSTGSTAATGPATSAPKPTTGKGTSGKGTTGSKGSATPSTTTTTPRGSTAATGSASSSTQTASPATIAANLAQAQASVASAQLTVKSDEAALAGTKLYSTATGTVASISGQVGTAVTAGTAGSSGSGSSGSGSSGSSAASAFSAASSSSSASSTSSTSGFIVVANLNQMQMVVSVSESDIATIHVGQAATVSVDALPNDEFAAKVTAISVLPTSSSGVVSYDVTLLLTQLDSQVRAGMSATATIVTGQAVGALTVDSAAINSRGTTSTITLDENGKMVVTDVITGLVGTSSTQIIAGNVKVGDEVAIPVTTALATASATSGTAGTLGGTSSFGGAAALAGGGGFARFGRGGG